MKGSPFETGIQTVWSQQTGALNQDLWAAEVPIFHPRKTAQKGVGGDEVRQMAMAGQQCNDSGHIPKWHLGFKKKKKKFQYFLCTGVFAYMYTCRSLLLPLEARRGCPVPWSIDSCKWPCGCWALSLGLSEEQPVLLTTERSLQLRCLWLTMDSRDSWSRVGHDTWFSADGRMRLML